MIQNYGHNTLPPPPHHPRFGFYLTHARFQEDEEHHWSSRPPPQQSIDTAVFNTMYLLALYNYQLDNLLKPLRSGVDIFLGCLRDEDEPMYSAKEVRRCYTHNKCK